MRGDDRFGDFGAPPLANTTIVLALFNYLWQTKRFPAAEHTVEMADEEWEALQKELN